ncbi:MAG: hypothetical protein IPP47_33015 [Bryobacterales bacterium]|nr:hypothetical protein [Bryobacterales bacterium]
MSPERCLRIGWHGRVNEADRLDPLKEPPLRILTRRIVEAIVPLAATVVVSGSRIWPTVSHDDPFEEFINVHVVYPGFTTSDSYKLGIGLNMMNFVNHG